MLVGCIFFLFLHILFMNNEQKVFIRELLISTILILLAYGTLPKPGNFALGLFSSFMAELLHNLRGENYDDKNEIM